MNRRARAVLIVATAVACLSGGAATFRAAQAPAPPRAATSRTGQQVFAQHCAECHGTDGRGDGPASFMLRPRPRDLTAGKFKIKSTESGSIPTDDDLLKTIRSGLHGTSMPAWQGVLSDEDIRRVVTYVKSLSARFTAENPAAIAHVSFGTTGASVARGARVYEKLQCGKCHGTDGRGTNAVATRFADDWGQPLRAADLTEPWTFRGGNAPANVYMRFRAGMSGTPMPSFKGAATDQEMWDLATYVASLARKPAWEMPADELARLYAAEHADWKRNPVGRGEYLVDTLGCAMCHSPLDENKRVIPGYEMAGGLRVRLEPFGDYPTGNLTSDKDTGLGTWTDAEIKQTLTRGILRDGTRLLPYPMDWSSFSTMSEDDLNAIVAYLRTIPPIRNRVPRPTRTALPLFLWGKFKMLILGDDPPMVFFPGNAGSR